jgi:hypothetical protein
VRARFAFPMQGTGRGIAAAPESMPLTSRPPSPAVTRARELPARGTVARAGPTGGMRVRSEADRRPAGGA